ncbi:MAG: hypothetical protein WC405_19945 [Syntrophales bacterium]
MNEAIREVKSIDSVSCWTNRFISVGGEIRFISLFGSSTRVNTIRAIILKGEVVYLQNCWTGKNRSKVKRSSHQVKCFTRQLARGVNHCLLYTPDYLVPEGEFAEKIFYGDSIEQIQQKFFYASEKRYSTPLLPTWTEWLWDQMAQAEDIDALGFNLVRSVEFLEENDLEERLFEAGSPLIAGGIAMNG